MENEEKKMDINNLEDVKKSSLSILEASYSLYLECMVNEMEFEKRLLEEIGRTLLPMLLKYLNPKKEIPFLVMGETHYENIVEKFIPVIKNMHDQRDRHKLYLSNLAELLKPIEKMALDQIAQGEKQ